MDDEDKACVFKDLVQLTNKWRNENKDSKLICFAGMSYFIALTLKHAPLETNVEEIFDTCREYAVKENKKRKC